jgi:hypothetical protein
VDTLFNDKSVDSVLKDRQLAMFADIDDLDAEIVLSADLAEFVTRYAANYRVETPVLTDNKFIPQTLTWPQHPDVGVVVRVLFKGDGKLFFCRPADPNPVQAPVRIDGEALEFKYVVPGSNPNELQRQLNHHIDQIQQALRKTDHEVSIFNDSLLELARTRLEARRAQLNQHNELRGGLAAMGFQLTRRNDGNEQVIIPVKQKPLPISTLPVPGHAPEPYLTLENLDEILGTIRAMVSVMERSPKVFREMEEEDLRTILLVGLNGLFEGGATGETFNGEGKADILIRERDRNIFIAECLIWDGPEHFRKKLDEQLFRYATWRDSQLVAIIFNRRRNFSEVIEKMRDVVRTHPQCISDLNYQHESGCRHLFQRTDDPERHFVLTAVAYDVPR